MQSVAISGSLCRNVSKLIRYCLRLLSQSKVYSGQNLSGDSMRNLWLKLLV